MNNQIDSSLNLASSKAMNSFNQSSLINTQINNQQSLLPMNAKLNRNSLIDTNLNQSNLWNFDSGIQTGVQTKMPCSEANSCTSRDDEMDTISSLSQNSNLDEITNNLSNNLLNNNDLIENQMNCDLKFNLNNNNLELNNLIDQNLQFNKSMNVESNEDTNLIANLNKNLNLNSSQNINTTNNSIKQLAFKTNQINLQNNNSQSPFDYQSSLNNQSINHQTNNQLIDLNTSNSNSVTNNLFNSISNNNHNLINQQQINFIKKSSSQTHTFLSNSSNQVRSHLNRSAAKIKLEPRTLIQNQNLLRKDIEEVINYLNDDDEIVYLKALNIICGFFEDEKYRKLIICLDELVRSLIRLASKSNDEKRLKYISLILNNFSLTRPGLQTIYQNNILPTLYKLLETNIDFVVNCSITTLHNLVLKQDGVKIAIRTTMGIPILVRLLSRDNFKFLAIVTDCLHLIAYSNQEAKQVILECDGPQELIRIMNGYNDYEKLKWITTRVLKVLSVCPANKKAIVKLGGMQALANNLSSSSSRIVFNSLWTLRNLSDAAIRENNLDQLLQKLVSLLKLEDPNIITCTVGILANLTCNNEFNKQIIYQINGVHMLLLTLIQAKDRQEILEPTLCALRHLTIRHQNAEDCQNLIRMNCGLQPIVKLLHPPSKWSVIKACINLIRNLALCAENSQPLRENNVIQRLYQLLFKANQEIKRTCATFTIENITNCSDCEGIKMYEIIEGSLGSLQALAKDRLNCELIINLGFIPVCIEIICNYQLESIQKFAIGCLSELAELQLGKHLKINLINFI